MNERIIEIKEEVVIHNENQTITLEAGDKIKVLKEREEPIEILGEIKMNEMGVKLVALDYGHSYGYLLIEGMSVIDQFQDDYSAAIKAFNEYIR